MRVEHDGEYALVASMGGAPKHPVWYYNLKADPDAVVIQDGPEPFDATTREVTGDERASGGSGRSPRTPTTPTTRRTRIASSRCSSPGAATDVDAPDCSARLDRAVLVRGPRYAIVSCRRHRFREEEALAVVAADGAHRGELGVGVDALGDDDEIVRGAEVDDRLQHRAVARRSAPSDCRNERSILIESIGSSRRYVSEL